METRYYSEGYSRCQKCKVRFQKVYATGETPFDAKQQAEWSAGTLCCAECGPDARGEFVATEAGKLVNGEIVDRTKYVMRCPKCGCYLE